MPPDAGKHPWTAHDNYAALSFVFSLKSEDGAVKGIESKCYLVVIKRKTRSDNTISTPKLTPQIKPLLRFDSEADVSIR